MSASLYGLYLSIDHIGSTAVPGLSAKDKIDIQITVDTLNAEFRPRLDSALASSGWPLAQTSIDHCPAGEASTDLEWEKLFFIGVHAQLPFLSNIHVRVLGRKNWRYPLREL